MKRMGIWILGCLCLFFGGMASGAEKPTVFHEGRLQVGVPLAWKESKQDTSGTQSVGGWESADRKNSFYVQPIPIINLSTDIRTALDEVINNFDQNEDWQLKKLGEFRDVKLNGLPATYVRVDLVLVAGTRKVPFVFHFAMVGATNSFYLLQGSNMEPVWKPREDEIIEMMKSFKVLKDE